MTAPHGHRPAGRSGLRSDGGMTVAELLVSMALILVVSSLITGTLVSTLRTSGTVNDDKDARAAEVNAGELLVRELRDAAAVTVPGTANPAASVTVWVDRNFDYARQPSEVSVWQVDGTRGALCATSVTTRCLDQPWISGLDVTRPTGTGGTGGTGGTRTMTLTLRYRSRPAGRSTTWTVALPNLG